MNILAKCRLAQNIYTKMQIITIVTIIITFANSQFPVKFAVVRNVQPSLNLDSFLSAIGKPEYDSLARMQTNYNMISLAGFNQLSTYSGLDSNLSPLMIWKKIYEVILGNKAHPMGTNSKQIQKHILDNIFHANGSTLLMHAQFTNAPISGSSPVTANSIATQIVTTATQLQLDGVSISFEDYNAVKQNTASDWLQNLLRNIRANSQNTEFTIALVIPPTYVNNMKIFKSPAINSLVDFFVLKYYGTAKSDYNSYQTIFERSAYYGQTSLFQFLRRDDIYIDICRTLVAKPVDSRTSFNNMQFMSQTDLDSAFMQALSKMGWFAGFANLYFQSDRNGVFVNAATKSIQTECLRYQNCMC